MFDCLFMYIYLFCCSVAKLCLTVCDSMDCSIPGFPVLPYTRSLLRFMSVDLVMLSNHLILCHLLLLLPSVLPSIRVFSNELGLHIRWPNFWSFSLTTVLPMNIHSWFPSRLTGLILLLSKGVSRVFSSTTIWKHQFFSAQTYFMVQLLHLYHDYWKNHSFDHTEFCWQNDAFTF